MLTFAPARTDAKGAPFSFYFPIARFVGFKIGGQYEWNLCDPVPAPSRNEWGVGPSGSEPTSNPRGGGGGPYWFSLRISSSAGPLLRGLIFNPNSGAITGSPAAAEIKTHYQYGLKNGVQRIEVFVHIRSADSCFGPATITIEPGRVAPPPGQYLHWSCGGKSQCASAMGAYTGIQLGPITAAACAADLAT